MPKETAVPEAPRAFAKVRSVDVKVFVSGYSHNEFDYIAEAGTRPETFLATTMWEVTAHRFAIGDKIFIEAEDGSWEASYRVRDQHEGAYAKLALLSAHEYGRLYEPITSGLPANFSLEWRGRIKRWCVVKDGLVLNKGHASASEAHSWLASQAHHWGRS